MQSMRKRIKIRVDVLLASLATKKGWSKKAS
jgi:hypothetical protein